MSQGTKPEGVCLIDRRSGERIPLPVVFSHRDDAEDVKVYSAQLPPDLADMDARAFATRYKLHVGVLPGRTRLVIENG